MPTFSERHKYKSPPHRITVREDAPRELRNAVVQLAMQSGLRPSQIRDIVCRVLITMPDPDNWSEEPNIRDEVIGLMMRCDWFKVYDIIEAIQSDADGSFTDRINDFFEARGIGWKLTDDGIEMRTDEASEASLKRAVETLEDRGNKTAASELQEAWRDASRRPEPDVTGAVQHSVAGLECLARDICGDAKATLGDLIRKRPDKLKLPPPLDAVAEKLWGYASEQGRHLREGRTPDRFEAAFVVAVAAALVSYLVH